MNKEITEADIDFFGETLAKAEGNKIKPEIYLHYIDDLMAAAIGDPTIKFLFVMKKGEQVGVLGVAGGKQIEDSGEIFRILREEVIGREC